MRQVPVALLALLLPLACGREPVQPEQRGTELDLVSVTHQIVGNGVLRGTLSADSARIDDDSTNAMFANPHLVLQAEGSKWGPREVGGRSATLDIREEVLRIVAPNGGVPAGASGPGDTLVYDATNDSLWIAGGR